MRRLLHLFRRNKSDPMRVRTSADSQVEDLEGQDADTAERKAFEEKSFEKAQEGLDHPFGTSSHHSDNPFREADGKN